MVFFKFFGSRKEGFSQPALGLYQAAVTAARAPEFYSRLGVPDTPDGRFDMIAIHVFLALRRLQREQGPTRDAAREIAQALTDILIADMDRNLREMGVGDLSVGKQVKALAAAFRGRVTAYDAALDRPDEAGDLAEALGRNIFRRGSRAPENGIIRIAEHIRATDAALTGQPWPSIAAGTIVFPPPPGVSK
ncbi:MAG: ubiquinol-cytochrome C chaperone [Rhodospirillales bacterium]|nr:ubiquinol-cytochrome C chaperone [Rhodospirillales bacterium]